MRMNRLSRVEQRGCSLFVILAISALLAWLGLLLFTRYVAPQSVLAFLIFFLLLSIALLCTLIPAVYFLSQVILARWSGRPNMLIVTRQSAWIAGWIILNLLLRAFHGENIFIALISFGIIIIGELLLLGRK